MIIADFVRAMENKDHRALSQCFSDHCRLIDYCPSSIGKENSFIYGPRAVDMFYHNRFVLRSLSIHDPIIVDERTVNYYANYGGPLVHVMATIDSYDPKTGLIKDMVIRPA